MEALSFIDFDLLPATALDLAQDAMADTPNHTEAQGGDSDAEGTTDLGSPCSLFDEAENTLEVDENTPPEPQSASNTVGVTPQDDHGDHDDCGDDGAQAGSPHHAHSAAPHHSHQGNPAPAPAQPDPHVSTPWFLVAAYADTAFAAGSPETYGPALSSTPRAPPPTPAPTTPQGPLASPRPERVDRADRGALQLQIQPRGVLQQGQQDQQAQQAQLQHQLQHQPLRQAQYQHAEHVLQSQQTYQRVAYPPNMANPDPRGRRNTLPALGIEAGLRYLGLSASATSATSATFRPPAQPPSATFRPPPPPIRPPPLVRPLQAAQPFAPQVQVPQVQVPQVPQLSPPVIQPPRVSQAATPHTYTFPPYPGLPASHPLRRSSLTTARELPAHPPGQPRRMSEASISAPGRKRRYATDGGHLAHGHLGHLRRSAPYARRASAPAPGPVAIPPLPPFLSTPTLAFPQPALPLPTPAFAFPARPPAPPSLPSTASSLATPASLQFQQAQALPAVDCFQPHVSIYNPRPELAYPLPPTFSLARVDPERAARWPGADAN